MQYIKELLQIAPIRDIKAILIKLTIDLTGCVDRGDLKRKLIANAPELQMEVEGRSKTTHEQR